MSESLMLLAASIYWWRKCMRMSFYTECHVHQHVMMGCTASMKVILVNVYMDTAFVSRLRQFLLLRE